MTDTNNNKIQQELEKNQEKDKKKERKERVLKPLATLGDYLKAHPDFYKKFGKVRSETKKKFYNNKNHTKKKETSK